jgi:c-di-GMP-binding flagellar brake protein YcgR
MAAQHDQPEGSENRQNGQNRRANPRHAVDCAVTVSPMAGAGPVPGRLVDLSLGGCRVEAAHRFAPGILMRVEVQFQLRGISFRVVGVTVGSRQSGTFAVRFMDMSARRRQELAEVLAEVAQLNAAKAAAASVAAAVPVSLPDQETPSKPQLAADRAGAATQAVDPIGQVNPAALDRQPSLRSVSPAAALKPAEKPEPPTRPRDRRSHGRHAVDTSANLLLVTTGISMPGRIVNLSLGGCRIRTEERFNVGIYVRVEATFYLHGLPFRVGGVSQAILDRNTIGVRFLDMSERRREQLTELIAEIAEANSCEAAAKVPGSAGGVSEGEAAAG